MTRLSSLLSRTIGSLLFLGRSKRSIARHGKIALLSCFVLCFCVLMRRDRPISGMAGIARAFTTLRGEKIEEMGMSER